MLCYISVIIRMKFYCNSFVDYCSLHLFQELGHLMPEMNLDVVMYGNEISKQCDGKTFESYNIKITVQQKLFHRRPSDIRKPHLVIGI